jgi:hypothetical protein
MLATRGASGYSHQKAKFCAGLHAAIGRRVAGRCAQSNCRTGPAKRVFGQLQGQGLDGACSYSTYASHAGIPSAGLSCRVSKASKATRQRLRARRRRVHRPEIGEGGDVLSETGLDSETRSHRAPHRQGPRPMALLHTAACPRGRAAETPSATQAPLQRHHRERNWPSSGTSCARPRRRPHAPLCAGLIGPPFSFSVQVHADSQIMRQISTPSDVMRKGLQDIAFERKPCLPQTSGPGACVRVLLLCPSRSSAIGSWSTLTCRQGKACSER